MHRKMMVTRKLGRILYQRRWLALEDSKNVNQEETNLRKENVLVEELNLRPTTEIIADTHICK